MAQSEFDNTYGVMLMGMGVGRDFPDFDDYDEVRFGHVFQPFWPFLNVKSTLHKSAIFINAFSF